MDKILKKAAEEKLKYNPNTGLFTWIVGRHGRARKGTIAGATSSSRGKKYRTIKIDKKNYKAHHLAWLFVYGEIPKDEIDHINGDGTDNRAANLRLVTHLENSRNQKKPMNNTSGVMGVCFVKASEKWAAMICVNYKQIWLGTFINKIDAIRSRKEAELKYGFHKNHGQ